MTKESLSERAMRILAAFRLADELYLVGSLERGVTVYGQQVRAHNLMWALRQADDSAKVVSRIAIVGGGIAGLTSAASALLLFPDAQVSVLEQHMDLCALQQGCDSRWLHPRIYDWPSEGSRAPSASLPVLNWAEGRASDVADQILRGFGRYIAHDSRRVSRNLRIFLGVKHLRISTGRTIEWRGRLGEPDGEFVRAGRAADEKESFDRIILAVGFGQERSHPGFLTPSYWRNEKLAQPGLTGLVDTYVVSGYGDGALVDLCRLTIERFRQDRILYDLFGDSLEAVEEAMRPIAEKAEKVGNSFALLQAADPSVLGDAVESLRKRIRKDTRVILHLSGRDQQNSALIDAFGRTSSFANRMLLYLLHRCGAFVPRFDRLEEAVAKDVVAADHVICRYGPDAAAHVRSMFTDPGALTTALERIKAAQAQNIRREWQPGSIPSLRE
jgi:hypothetical protein